MLLGFEQFSSFHTVANSVLCHFVVKRWRLGAFLFIVASQLFPMFGRVHPDSVPLWQRQAAQDRWERERHAGAALLKHLLGLYAQAKITAKDLTIAFHYCSEAGMSGADFAGFLLLRDRHRMAIISGSSTTDCRNQHRCIQSSCRPKLGSGIASSFLSRRI